MTKKCIRLKNRKTQLIDNSRNIDNSLCFKPGCAVYVAKQIALARPAMPDLCDGLELGVLWSCLSRALRSCADLRQAPHFVLASNLTAECADGCDSQDKTFGSCQEFSLAARFTRGPSRPLPAPASPSKPSPGNRSTSQATHHLIRLLDKQRLRR